MEASNPTKHWGLLITRGLLYASIGVILFLFTGSPTSLLAQLITGLTIAAGICGFVYSYANLRADRNYIWELLKSLSDIAFGIVMVLYATGDIDSFLGIVSFWAVMFAFLESVQSMYLFMVSGVSSANNFPAKIMHFLSVAFAGALAYLLLMRPAGFNNSLAIVGLFPVALGVIIILLAIQQKRQAILVNKTR